MFNRQKFKEFARIQLQGRLTVPMLIVIFTGLILKVFDLPNMVNGDPMQKITNLLAENKFEEIKLYLISIKPLLVLNLILGIVSTLVSCVFTMAGLNVYLKMSKSPEPVKFSSFIEGFSNWFKAIRTELWMNLWLFIWGLLIIPAFGVILLMALIFGISYAATQSSFVISLYGFLSFVIIIAACIPLIIKAISYSQAFFFAAEYENIGAVKALDLSKKITDGHKMDLFALDLSFIGWIFLTALTMGLLDLWVVPYITMTRLNAYHAMLKEAVDSGKIKLYELGMEEEEMKAYETTQFIGSDNSNEAPVEEQVQETEKKPSEEITTEEATTEETSNSSENLENKDMEL